VLPGHPAEAARAAGMGYNVHRPHTALAGQPPISRLDDLCLAMARFLTCLERADADALKDLHDRVSQKLGPDDPLAALVYQVLSWRRSGQPAKP
jgi:hypothetical protein